MKKYSIAIILLVLLAACSHSNNNAKDAKAEETIKPVKAFLLKSDTIVKQVSLPGELLPYEKVQIRAKVPGYIAKIKVDIGSIVKKDEIIAVIEAPEIQSKVAEAAGKKVSAESKFRSGKDTYERLLEASKGKGVVSTNDLQVAYNKMMSDSAELKAASYAYDSYKQTESYLVITAPYNGIITKRNADEGTYVGNPGDKPIVEIENNSVLRLRVAVPEALAAVKLKGNKVTFATRGIPNKKFEAALSRKAGSIDVETRSEVWEFDVNNAEHILKPGMFADVKLSVSREGASFVVPFSAVVTTLERKFVIRANGGKTEWVDVSQGINLPDKAEIFGALSEGDTLVLKANEEMKPATKIAPKLD